MEYNLINAHVMACDLINAHVMACDLIHAHVMACDLINAHVMMCDLINAHVIFSINLRLGEVYKMAEKKEQSHFQAFAIKDGYIGY